MKIKAPKAPKKHKTKNVDTGALPDRGIGSTFAYAVSQAADMKKEQQNFLGKASETISIEEMTRLVTKGN